MGGEGGGGEDGRASSRGHVCRGRVRKEERGDEAGEDASLFHAVEAAAVE